MKVVSAEWDKDNILSSSLFEHKVYAEKSASVIRLNRSDFIYTEVSQKVMPPISYFMLSTS